MRLLLIAIGGGWKKVASHIKRGLEREGYAVDVADNWEDACSMAMAYEYDLIILNIMLPNKDGIQVLKEVRANKHYTLLYS